MENFFGKNFSSHFTPFYNLSSPPSGGFPPASGSVPGLPPWNQTFFTGVHGRSGYEATSGQAEDQIAGNGTFGDGKGGNEAGFPGNGGQILLGRNTDPNMDPRKLKRIISNRVSAQKSRLKKVQYVADMERKMKALEAHIAILSPQVEMYKNQQKLLQMEQRSLNQKIFSFSRNKLLKDAEIEENRAEVNRLRQLHLKLQQQNHNQGGGDGTVGWPETAALEQCMYQPEMPTMGSSSHHSNKDIAAENGDRAVEGNGPGQINLTAQHRTVEYKWMPTPGLRRVYEPTSYLLGHPEMPKPN